MSPEDQVLVAMLTLLRDGLAPVIDELLAGELDQDDRAALARSLRTVADSLAPLVVVEQVGASFCGTPRSLGGGAG